MRTLTFIAIGLLAACSHKDAGSSSAPNTVKLDTYGVQLDVPGKAKVTTSDLDGTVTISGRAFGEIFVELEKTPTTLDDLKKGQAGTEVTNFKSETLPDGFAATYDYKMGSTQASTVAVHRVIAGKHFQCHANSSDKGWLSAAMAACKSLRS